MVHTNYTEHGSVYLPLSPSSMACRWVAAAKYPITLGYFMLDQWQVSGFYANSRPRFLGSLVQQLTLQSRRVRSSSAYFSESLNANASVVVGSFEECL
jgi:hypothetical protein